MNIEEKLINEFPGADSLPEPEEFFLENSNVMELTGSSDLMTYVPAYMLWCMRHPGEGVVEDWTINALAEYGRCKDPENEYLNFMHRCNKSQKEAVVSFLEHYLYNDLVPDEAQITRALKNWKH